MIYEVLDNYNDDNKISRNETQMKTQMKTHGHSLSRALLVQVVIEREECI